jgi:SOS-response transcriptional repressor LexA
MIGLTDMQQQALDYIDGRIEDTGTTPSLQEIADSLGLRSRSSAHRLVAALEERGRIRRLTGRRRAIEVVKPNDGRLYVEPLPEVRLAMERYSVEHHVSVKTAAEAALRDWFVGGAP